MKISAGILIAMIFALMVWMNLSLIKVGYFLIGVWGFIGIVCVAIIALMYLFQIGED